MSEKRVSSFLHLIRNSQRGKLKIYLGYCAGVGKTYQMLQEAGRMRQDGVDVIVGYVETHGRRETEALLAGLEILPRRTTTYRGIEITEMDLDAILARKPEVVLVDELAHTNVPGSRNAKRFLDVEEIRANGIHVISTMNIQHLESLYDTVEDATGVKVRERVPDRILIEADQIVNVDIPVDELVIRMREGRIYVPEGIESALRGFFQTDRLEQLRELTLRELAAQIDFRRRDQVEDDAPPSPDQVMVCLSSRGENRDRLLRYASRLAGRLNRNWYAVYVQTPGEDPERIDAATQRVLGDALATARQLGGTVFTYKGEDVVDTILQFAREYRVGHIVIGTPGRCLTHWQRLLGKRSIAERLIEESRDTTIVVIDTRRSESTTLATPKQNKRSRSFDARYPLRAGETIIWPEIVERNQAIRELVELTCAHTPGLIAEQIWTKVLAREQQGSTYLNDLISFPHCRIAGLTHPVVGVGISRAGILDPITGSTTRIVILLLSPEEDPELHIRMIGHLARFATDDILLRSLLEADNIGQVDMKLKIWQG
jgi:two-component system, OmpR family, sensor histidine kinase KdpD